MSHRQIFASGETIREQKDEIAKLQAEIERLRLTDAERRAVSVAMQCVEAARCQRHPEEESEADLLHSVHHTLGRILDRMH